LEDLIKERFDKILNEDGEAALHKLVTKFNDPLKDYNTEKKRLSFYKQFGLFADADEKVIEEVKVEKVRGSKLSSIDKSHLVFRIPLAASLKRLLSIDGLFTEMLSYIEFLKQKTSLIMNFI